MNSDVYSTRQPKVSMGMPVYNAEKFLKTRLDNILSQTFANFELIISDNASTDSTISICEKYARQDKRIRFIKQKENMGIFWNFNFVLQQSKYEYFVWAAADDLWEPTFIEKNVDVLESKENVVASISDVDFYGTLTDVDGVNPRDSQARRHKKYKHVCEASGSFENRVKTYLRFFRATGMYAVYRTTKLRTIQNLKPMGGWDLLFILNSLKYGNYNVINEVLMHRYDDGFSVTTLYDLLRKQKISILGSIFPLVHFTFWCAQNLGIKIVLKNIGWFILVNGWFEYTLLSDLFRKIIVVLKK